MMNEVWWIARFQCANSPAQSEDSMDLQDLNMDPEHRDCLQNTSRIQRLYAVTQISLPPLDCVEKAGELLVKHCL